MQRNHESGRPETAVASGVQAVRARAHQGPAAVTDVAEEFLRQALEVLPVGVAVLALPAWQAGTCAVDGLYGVRRDSAGLGTSGTQALRQLRVLPGFEDAVAEVLFGHEAEVGFLSQATTTMIHGMTSAQPQTAHIPVRSQGQQHGSLLLGVSSSTTRTDLLDFRNLVQPLMDATLAELRAIRVMGRASPDVSSELPTITHALLEAVIGFDRDGRVRDLNDAAEALLRTRRSDALGSDITTWLPEDPFVRLHDALAGARDTPGNHTVMVHDQAVPVRRADGTTVVADLCVMVARDRPDELATAILSDLTAITDAERRARLSAERFRTFADPAQVGILQADRRFECIYVNQRWIEIHLMGADTAAGMGWVSSIHRDDVRRVLGNLRAAMIRGEDLTTEFRIASIHGEPGVVQFGARPVRNAEGEFDGFIATVNDVSEQRRAHRELQALAERDLLTGLANRAAIESRMASKRRHDDVAGLLYVDLDGFKTVNDTYGHPVGDLLLKEVADRLRKAVGPDDVVARMGGDEFVVLLSGAPNASEAERVATAVSEAIIQPIHVAGHVLHTSPSIGVAMHTEAEGAKDLLSRADAAMYQAKAAGRNTVEFYTPSLHRVIDKRTRLLTDVHRALQRDEFDVGYHAIEHTGRPDLLAIEALLRWEHPVLGEVSPLECVPLLESTGLIRDVGRTVLLRACRQLVLWRDEGVVGPDVRISVNVSPQQLRRQGSLDDLSSVLGESGLPPANLMVELTESTLLDSMDMGSNVLEALHDRGVTIAVDDFGTGFSSLAYLKGFPVDVLKIDRDFVAEMRTSDADRSIVQAICALGASLSLLVIAEGVTDEETLDILRGYGCEAYQGYLLGEPGDAESFTTTLRERFMMEPPTPDTRKRTAR